LTFGNLGIEGRSRGGDRTWFRVQPPGLAFDVGRGALELSGVRDVFVTHGHLDHCLGVPFVLSYRARHGGGSTRIACPRPLAAPLARWLEGAAELEASRYDYEIAPMEPGDRLEVGPGLEVEAFATHHVVPSLGYHLRRERRHLREQYQGTPGSELAALKQRGVEIEERVEEDWLSYCGDTAATVLDEEPRLLSSRVLLLECTFLDAAHQELARRYGHIHLDDLAARVDRFRNEHLVLCHLSRRHSRAELRRAVEEKLRPLARRVELVVE
jgi:ribonuclease Z